MTGAPAPELPEDDEGTCSRCGEYVTRGRDGVWRDAGDWGCAGGTDHRTTDGPETPEDILAEIRDLTTPNRERKLRLVQGRLARFPRNTSHPDDVHDLTGPDIPPTDPAPGEWQDERHETRDPYVRDLLEGTE